MCAGNHADFVAFLAIGMVERRADYSAVVGTTDDSCLARDGSIAGKVEGEKEGNAAVTARKRVGGSWQIMTQQHKTAGAGTHTHNHDSTAQNSRCRDTHTHLEFCVSFSLTRKVTL